MDSARGFWSLIAAMVVAGICYLAGSKALIDRIMKKRED
jgi:hypothetical protein